MSTIGSRAFLDCTGLTSIKFANGVSRIGRFAFCNCNSLTTIIIPNSVNVIGENAFSGCYGLTNIKISNCMKEIGNGAFTNCSGLTCISIPDSVDSIGHTAFLGCKALNSIYIPDSVTSIGKNAFCGCESLTYIYIPFGTRKKFEELLPKYKEKLVEQDDSEELSTEVTDEDLANAWTDEYGVKYSADRKRLLKAPEGLREYIIKTGTKVICDMAFCEFWGRKNKTDYDGIHSITIPDSVVKIGNLPFNFCYNLWYIFIPILTKRKYEKLLSGYQKKLVELLDINDKDGWRIKERRPFNPNEIASIKKAEVVDSQYGNSVWFQMKSGGQTFVTLAKYSTLAIGDVVDLSKASIVILEKKGECNIMRVEA